MRVVAQKGRSSLYEKAGVRPGLWRRCPECSNPLWKRERYIKKILTVFLIVLLALTVLCVTGVLLFRHFVADKIMDKGGMMNPDYIDGSDAAHILDGDHTYVDNEKLLQVITGTWSSEDGHYVIKLDSDYSITLSLDGEPLLDDHIQFVYLQLGIVRSTEFSLDSCILQKEDGSPVGEITSFYHEVSEEDTSGRLIVEIDLAGSSKTAEFKNEDARDALSGDGIVWKKNEYTWNDTTHIYQWKTEDGIDYFNISFSCIAPAPLRVHLKHL